jgi:hypothetical protein
MNRSVRVRFVAPLAVLFGALPAAPDLLAQAGTQQPVEWVVTGMAAPLYAIVGISDGGHALSLTRLADVVAGPNQFGATAAIVNAEPYRGRRVRVRALIRTDSATVGGSTWLRIDGVSGSLQLENNMSRMLSGTTGWSEQITTLDVPTSATRIIYGLLLSGGGTLHAKDVSIENLAPSSPATP